MRLFSAAQWSIMCADDNYSAFLLGKESVFPLPSKLLQRSDPDSEYKLQQKGVRESVCLSKVLGRRPLISEGQQNKR